MNELEKKQEELIAHYENKPRIEGMSPTQIWMDWDDKKYQLLDEIAALKQGEPVSDVCDNWMPDKGTSATRCVNCGKDRWEHEL